MKLISKTLIWYFFIAVPLLLLAGVFAYHSILYEMKENSDEILLQKKNHVKELLLKTGENGGKYVSDDGLTIINLSGNYSPKLLYSDTCVYDWDENEKAHFRVLKGFVKYQEKNYELTLLQPTFNRHELLESLIPIFSLILLFLLLAFFGVNLVLSKTLWSPFYRTLGKLSVYDLKNKENIFFEPSSTKEFRELNDTLNKMSAKISLDFLHQKEFTENAAHEMQTPLAVIKAKLGLLMQSDHLKEEDMRHIQAIENTVIKLSSINKALLLLAKIENKQFEETGTTSIRNTMQKIIAHHIDFIEAKNISLATNFEEDYVVRMNPELAEILFTNLLQNAIRHNYEKGKINIKITENTLVISNTGEALKIKSEELFLRFKKNDASKESMGLGLAIVKSICDMHRIHISYDYQNAFHVFTLRF